MFGSGEDDPNGEFGIFVEINGNYSGKTNKLCFYCATL